MSSDASATTECQEPANAEAVVDVVEEAGFTMVPGKDDTYPLMVVLEGGVSAYEYAVQDQVAVIKPYTEGESPCQYMIDSLSRHRLPIERKPEYGCAESKDEIVDILDSLGWG